MPLGNFVQSGTVPKPLVMGNRSGSSSSSIALFAGAVAAVVAIAAAGGWAAAPNRWILRPLPDIHERREWVRLHATLPSSESGYAEVRSPHGPFVMKLLLGIIIFGVLLVAAMASALNGLL